MKQPKWKAKVETNNQGQFFGRNKAGALCVFEYGYTKERAYQVLNRG